MKKILIALDNNVGAHKVAAGGYELAQALDAHTILMHVTSDSTYYSSLNYSPIMGFDAYSNSDVEQTNVVDHSTGKEYKVQSHYNKYWMNSNGEYISTNQNTYDPNADVNMNRQKWEELHKND